MRRVVAGLLAGLAAWALAAPAGSQAAPAAPASPPPAVVVKLGTLVPEGTTWHDMLLRIRQEWRRLSQGRVELRIYPGGVLGDEAELVRKLQRRGLDAVAISGFGLGRLDAGFDCLGIPLAFRSEAELDAVREAVAPRLEARLEASGFRILHWSETGWLYFFTRTPVRTPDDLRKLKIWIPSGAPSQEALYESLGFNIVPLPATDVMPSLQTGLIEAIEVPPLYALMDRSWQQARHVLDMRLAVLPAATVISEAAWRRVPADLQPALLAAAREAGEAYEAEIRASGPAALREMQRLGLKVVPLDAEAAAAWDREMAAAYPKLRGRLGPPELFDEVLRLRDEHRGKGR